MKTFHVIPTLLFLMFIFRPCILQAQQNQPSSEILSQSQVSATINDAVRKQFDINFTIIRVYKYADRQGRYYCVLTEKFDSLAKDKEGKYDTLHYAIRAIDLREDSGKLRKVWEINDHAIRDPKIEGIEQSIWFWTKYIEFTDYDGDGLIEPIIVYGSNSESDPAGGRIKFIIYYKGRKVAIRHQDSDLDEGRGTQIDKEFYTLPSKLKERVKIKMLAMNKAGQAIFEKTSF
ncbi:MAG TPA: hypothetical protein VL727_19760 [Puia sp.]|nr:hypothetical protein [Puia sp.]